MRELVSDLENARRLSMNFHFQKNSAILDDKVRQDIPRTANFLKSEGARFREILLAGFTDSTGTFDGNRAVAFARAMSFKKALAAVGVADERIVAKSYGSLLPVGCNSTEAGREKNRRVEIWVKE
jgi:phosphate transport system substrate-binding protein